MLLKGIDTAKDIDGASGPSQVSAEIRKHMICSRFRLKESEKLELTIADLVKIRCIEQVPCHNLAEFLAGPLILDKDPGSESPQIRPQIKLIPSKAVTGFLNNNNIRIMT